MIPNARKADRPTLSVVTPAFNEQDNLPTLNQRLHAVLDPLNIDWEWVVVDDHSTDATWETIRRLSVHDARLRAIRFSRNFGSHGAMSCALQHAAGQCAVIIAADLQDPPETLPLLIERWQAGHEVVWAVRQAREGASLSTRFFAAVYYRLMRRVALADMPAQGADFLLMDRKVIDAYNSIGEKNSSLLATVLWMGFRQTSIEYVKRARHAGATKWTLAKKLKLVVDSVVSFSYAPIRAMSYLGIAMAGLGFGYAAIVVVGRALGWVVSGTGFAALITVLLVGQGLILTTLGVLGEYLWRTFDESRGRPRFIVEDSLGPAQHEERPHLVDLSARATAARSGVAPV
jgi:polyisoprenyl-phosphate glycosyltransferase